MTAPGTVPVPRSFQAIYGEVIDAFLSRTGARTIDIVDPANFIIIAAAQSDLRNTSDIFALLAASSLKNAQGLALDRIGFDLNRPRRSASYATGAVNFTDTAFNKISTTIYAGAAAPNAGTSTLSVADASAFPASGKIYIDRGTLVVEGPLSYTSKTQVGSFWTLALAASTTHFHNVNAPVVLAQGGDRPIPAGTVVQTQPGSLSAAVNYATTFPAIIADGEVEVDSVPVTAQQPGSIGNAQSGTVNTVVTASIATLSVTNPLPYSNGFNVQNDDDYRADLQTLLQTRSRATPLAITFNSLGVTSPQENKTVVSAAITQVPSEPTTLYIDDGSGYQELDQGIALETIVARALGGEYAFSLAAQPPVTKAFVQTTLQTPFALVPGAQLAIRIAGITTEHSFSADEFFAIGSATADEVASAINSDPALAWSARVVDGGLAVAFFAQAETNEDVECVPPAQGQDANEFLGLPAGISYTLRLYRNDVLLYKDGIAATVYSNVQSAWSSTISSGVQVEVQVDNTPPVVYTFVDADFVTAATGFTTVAATNSLAAWATVWNAKVPGLTATASGGQLVFTSNLGTSARSQLVFSPPLANLPTITYGSKTGNFTVGDAILGHTSSATAVILDDNDFGSTGVLTLSTVVGTFVSGELITDAHTGSANSTSALITTPPNLVTLGMFSPLALDSVGRPRDYALNRNTGKIKLFDRLLVGETLTAGTLSERAYTQSTAHTLSTVTLPNPGTLWVVVDGAAQLLTTGLNAASSITTNSGLGNGRVRYTVADTAVFGSAAGMKIAAGDFFISYDTNLSVIGAWRISSVLQTTPWNWFEIERPAGGDQSGVTPALNGFAFVRANSVPQSVRLVSGSNQTLASVATEIGSQLQGAEASVYRNQYLRLTTNSYDSAGDISVVAADQNGALLGFTSGLLVSNSANHSASVEAGNTDVGTPILSTFSVSALTGVNSFTASATGLDSGKLLYWEPRLPGTGYSSWGRTADTLEGAIVNGTAVTIEDQVTAYSLPIGALVRSGTTVTGTTTVSHNLRTGDFVYVWPVGTADANFAAGYKLVVTTPAANTFTYTEAGSSIASVDAYLVGLDQGHLVNDQVFGVTPYSISPRDTLNLVLDNDEINKNYSLPMWRQLTPSGGAIYSSSGFGVLDVDNGDLAPSAAFGSSVPDLFADFALFQRARGKSHAAGGSSSNKALLWRWTRLGPEGNFGTIAYVNPTAPSSALAYTVINGAEAAAASADFQLSLPSGAARTGIGTQATTHWTVAVATASPADTLTFTYSKLSIAIGGLARSGSTVTVTTASAHGYHPGDIVYISGSSDGNYPNGPKNLATASGSTFTYIESGTGAASLSTSFASASSADPTLTSSVIAGDIVTIGQGSGFPVADQGTFRVTAVTGTTFSVKIPTGTGSVVTTPVSQFAAANIVFYPITSQTASQIATWVNANASSVVNAVAVENGGGSPGAGAITISTEDEFLQSITNSSTGSVARWPLFDGINWIQSSDLSASPNTITLKNAVASDLTSNADFGNEVFRLVPVTTADLATWLSSPAISGFYAGSEVLTSARARRLQLTSTTPGSAGSIEVIGGTADSAGASLVGTGTLTAGGWASVTLPTPQSSGFVGGDSVALQSGTTQVKVTPWNSSSTLTITAGGNVAITGTGAVWTLRQTLNTVSDRWSVRAVGRFAAVTLIPIGGNSISSSVIETDWVVFNLSGAHPGNNGTFRIVASSHSQNTYWIENPDAVTEVVTDAGSDAVSFYSYDSTMPGDSFVIDSTAFGTAAQGTYTITAFGGSSTAFVVSPAPGLVSATVMGANFSFVRLVEAKPLRLIKQINVIAPDVAAGFTDILFTTPNLITRIGAASSSVIQALDKLEFPSLITAGADAYTVATGLIGAVNQVLYGEADSPSIFPGIVAAGSNVNIEGALIKRIEVALAIRINSSIVTGPQAISLVQNAVAALINSLKVGQSVSLSSIVSAAAAVAGVTAVSVTSPAYSSSSDTITLQPREKARILSLSSDILVEILS